MKAVAVFLLSVLALFFTGCTALPSVSTEPDSAGKDAGEAIVEPAAPLPEAQSQSRSPAVTALLAKARSERADGRPEQATVSLERALRIEARDAELWLELAGARFDAADFDASVQFADKALRLAGNNETLRSQAEKLGRAARRQIR